jgi:hypothetical protein
MAGVFISYRRGDASGYAGRLREGLDRRLGEGHVFRDADAIEPGQDFVQAIETRVGECDALLALIGQDWLHATNATGQRRLDLADDFVALEIAGALKRSEVLVVPVLVEGACMPAADELPPSIRSLAHRQAVTIRDETWDQDVGRLASVLARRLGLMGAPRDAIGTRGESMAQPASPTVGKLRIGGVVVIVLAIAALLIGRFREHRIETTAGTAERSASSETPGSEPGAAPSSSSGSYGIDIPRITEFADGKLTHTLISGSVTPRGNVRLVRLRIRFANDAQNDANFWDRSYRLLVGDQTLAPTSNLDEVVSAHSVKDGIVSFEVPAGTGKAALRVDAQGDPPGTLPLDLSTTGRGVVPEDTAVGEPLAHAVLTRLAQDDQPLVSNRSVSLTLAGVTSRRFVNTLRVIFAIRMNNLQNYMQHFGSEGVRVLVNGLPTAPVDSPNETVAGGSSSPLRDFVFDLPTSTERVILRATLDGAVSEKPFSLGQSSSR